MFWCHGAQNTGHPTVNSNLRWSALYDHNARPSQTDRQTDKHHGNSATIRSNERIERCPSRLITYRLRYVTLVTPPRCERSIAISLSVCLSVCVCLSANISLKPLNRSSRIFLCRSSVVVARSSSGGVAMSCTSGFMDDVAFGRNGPYGDAWKAKPLTYSGVAIPGQSLMSMSALFCTGMR